MSNKTLWELRFLPPTANFQDLWDLVHYEIPKLLGQQAAAQALVPVKVDYKIYCTHDHVTTVFFQVTGEKR